MKNTYLRGKKRVKRDTYKKKNGNTRAFKIHITTIKGYYYDRIYHIIIIILLREHFQITINV